MNRTATCETSLSHENTEHMWCTPSRSRWLLGCALGGLLACLAHNDAFAQAETQRPALTVKWEPTCNSSTDADAYFSLEVFDDGLVRYDGGTQAREVGERRKRIDASEVKKLLKAADAFMRGSKQSIAKPSDTDAGRSYCINAVRRESRHASSAAKSGSTEQARRFSSVIARIVGERAWVCPARIVTSEQAHALHRTAYCPSSEWGPRLDAFFRAPTNCAVYHSVQLYDDGTLYYYASTRQAGLIRKRVLADAYYVLSRSQVERVVSLVRTFDLGRSEMAVETLTGPRDQVGENEWSEDPRELAQLQNALHAEAGVEWAQVPPEGAPCAAPGPNYLRLRSDRPAERLEQGAH